MTPQDDGEATIQALRNHVAKEIGPIAKPRQIMIVPELPKTRSGKIMRRLLKDVAENREVGDVTTLADSSVMNLISEGMSSDVVRPPDLRAGEGGVSGTARHPSVVSAARAGGRMPLPPRPCPLGPRSCEDRAMTRIGIVTASTRPRRIGHHVAAWVRELAPAGVELVDVDLRELALPLLDEPEMPSDGNYVHEHTRRWAAIVEGLDAVVFVMPEYNRGYSAGLKNAIDYLYDEWYGEPVACVGYGWSGAQYARVGAAPDPRPDRDGRRRRCGAALREDARPRRHGARRRRGRRRRPGDVSPGWSPLRSASP